MKKNLLLPVLALLGSSSTAMADPFYNSNIPAAYHEVPQSVSHPYIGIAYGLTKVSDDYFDGNLDEHTDIDYDSLMLQVGYEMNPYIAFEFRYWFSMGDGDYSLSTNYPIPPAEGSYKDFNAWGLYLKPQYPVSPEFSIYGLLGFSGVQVDGQPDWYDNLVDDTSFSFGIGGAFNFTENISAFIDYVQLYNNTYGYDYYYGPYYYDPQGTDIYTVNFGLTYKF